MEEENKEINQGRLFIVSAPSGTGKTTLCNALLEKFGDIIYSVSTTTREPREGELEGSDYFFVTRDEFVEGIGKEDWVEWAEVHGNYYGTSYEFLDSSMLSGKDVLLDIDVQGAVQILEKYPEAVTIFIMPPTIEILRERLEKRGTDSNEVIEKRLENAVKEISRKDTYSHVIVNDRLEEAVKELTAVFEKDRSGD